PPSLLAELSLEPRDLHRCRSSEWVQLRTSGTTVEGGASTHASQRPMDGPWMPRVTTVVRRVSAGDGGTGEAMDRAAAGRSGHCSRSGSRLRYPSVNRETRVGPAFGVSTRAKFPFGRAHRVSVMRPRLVLASLTIRCSQTTCPDTRAQSLKLDGSFFSQFTV